MKVATDEEEQLQVTNIVLPTHLQKLKDEVRNLKDTEIEVREMNHRLQMELEEAKAEFQTEIAEVKRQFHNQASIATASSAVAQPNSNLLSATIPSLFQRNIVNHDGLPTDTFTLMMTSPLRSQAWLFGIFTFTFQMVLIIMIASDQLKESRTSSLFNVPFKVNPVVRAGQLFTIFFALATQNDIIASIRLIIMFWSNKHWDRSILQREEGAPSPTTAEWLVHIIVPNGMKLSQGILVIMITFIIIVQSDNIIDLLKDFTALMVLSETDNIFFGLASKGYVGSELQRKSIQALGVKIQNETSEDSGSNRNTNRTASSPPSVSRPHKDFFLRPIILLFIAMVMVSGWLYIVSNQANGTYFNQRYPNCTVEDAFELAVENFGDGVCYGGPLNSLECEFEGGDCVNFNLAFPLCKGDKRVNVQNSLGNGKCEKLFMSADCDYDGGDCCPYSIIKDPSFGDGNCDERMNTEGCGYDNGDCVDYNRDFSQCPYDVVFNNPFFGDGQCNGGVSSTKSCRYDDGDCNEFILDFPDCPLDDLSEIPGADDVVIGDGMCNSGIYNTDNCGYEFGDCNRGQIGQTVLIPDEVEWFTFGLLYFSKTLSLDGTTMALGMHQTNEDGNFRIYSAPGKVRVWRYDNIKKMWQQLGNDIVGLRDNDDLNFGCRMSLSSSGNRIAISSESGVWVYDLNATNSRNDWNQVWQILIDDSFRYSNAVMSADGTRVALIPSWHEIHIYHLGSNDTSGSNHHTIINQDVDLSVSNHLTFNSLDGSTLLLSNVRGVATDVRGVAKDVVRVFRFNPYATTKPVWTQIGQDIDIEDSLRDRSTLSPSTAMSGDGNRISISFNSTSTDAPGQVNVFDYDYMSNTWILVGVPIKSSSSTNGDGFGYSIHLSSDGNLLVIGSNAPGCQRRGDYPNEFVTDGCTTGSVELYNYNPRFNRFRKVHPNPASPYKANRNVLNLADLSDSTIFGLHFSTSGDGTVLSISGYNADDKNAFVHAYNLDEMFYTRCTIYELEWVDGLGNGFCDDRPPYNSEDCGFDGGDCDPKPVKGYPDCIVHYTELIGDGECYDPYNSEACGFDGGDCVPKPVEGYPADCIIIPEDHVKVGDGQCDEFSPHNSEACEFDGGDCDRKPVDDYPECFVEHPNWIGNTYCNSSPYNTTACGFDGGDCLEIPVEGYPNCLMIPQNHHWIGDGNCRDDPPYNREECGFDGGDCEQNPVEGYPQCFVHDTDKIGDGICNLLPPYNTKECGFDGGDCL